VQSVPITTNVVSESCSWRSVLNTTLCDKICQWFSLGTQVSSTNKTDCHYITEIVLKVALGIFNMQGTWHSKNCIHYAVFCIITIERDLLFATWRCARQLCRISPENQHQYPHFMYDQNYVLAKQTIIVDKKKVSQVKKEITIKKNL
jgi:hypothetical protein